MTEPVHSSFYGVRTAQDGELAALAAAGDSQARDELSRRLPDQLAALLDLYLIVHQQNHDQAIDALNADILHLRARA